MTNDLYVTKRNGEREIIDLGQDPQVVEWAGMI